MPRKIRRKAGLGMLYAHRHRNQGCDTHKENSQGTTEQNALPKAEQTGYNLRFMTWKTLPSAYGDRWRDSPLFRVYPEKLGFLTWQDLKLWGIDLTLTEKTPLVIFYIWSNNATRFPLNYTRALSPGSWKDGNAQRNGSLGDHQNSFLPEKKWEGVTG